MGFQKVMQHVQECPNVRLVTVPLRRTDVVHDHVADSFGAVLVLQEILSERGSGDFRQVLVLGDGEDLVLNQAAERDAIFQADHVGAPPLPVSARDARLSFGAARASA
jgi:hypothetical protein